MLVALAALLTTPAYAEDNALAEGNESAAMLGQEQSAAVSPSTWSASLEWGFSMASGNNNTLNSNVKFFGAKLIGRDKIELILEGSYGEAEMEQAGDDGAMSTTDAVTDQQALAFTWYEKRIGERYVAYPFIEMKHNELAQIELRMMTGFGGGYYFIENEQAEFLAVTGAAYIREDLTTDESDDYGVFFIGLSHKLALSETSRISESVDYLPKIEDMGDYRIKAAANIETDIWSNISLKFTVTDEYDSEPPEGVEENDLSLSTSLVFTL